jgi:glycerophosphoryl diester phosphodiesterase
LVVATLERRNRRDRVLVSSFHLPTVDRVRELDASVPTAFLTGMGLDPLQVLDVCAAHKHGAYHPVVVMLQGAAAAATAARAHDLGIGVNVWTVNDEAEIRRLADAGVDGIVTDVPDVARAVLDGR